MSNYENQQIQNNREELGTYRSGYYGRAPTNKMN